MVIQALPTVFDSIWTFLREIIPVVSPLITAILTVLLVFLYYKQSKILDRQKELNESEQRALPRILTYRLFSWKTLFQYEEEIGPLPDLPDHPDRYAIFNAYLTNPGKGIAEDLHIELQISSPSYSFLAGDVLARWTNTDQMSFNDDGGAIAPEENEVTLYTGSFWYPEQKIPDDLLHKDISYDPFLTPSELLWVLEENDESPVKIGLFFHYKDGTGIREPIQLLTSKVELDSYADLTEAWRSGDPTDELEPMYELESSSG